MNFDPTLVNSAEDNANDYANKVDTELAVANIKDEEGNAITVNRLAGSPTWLLALAQGSIVTEWQERLRKADYSLDPSNCTDEQVPNLAQIAGIVTKTSRTPFVTLKITNPYDFSLYLTSDNCYAEDSVYTNRWYLGQGINLYPGQEVNVNFYCAKEDVSVPANTAFTLTSITGSFEPIVLVSDTASKLEEEAMSIAQLRNEIQLGFTHIDIVTQCERAISTLNGVTKCSIYFNKSATTDLVLPGNITVPPRKAFVSIQGADIDKLLAQTYFRFMNVDTVNTLSSLQSTAQVGALAMTVNYEQTGTQTCFIKVVVHPYSVSDVTYKQRIIALLLSYSGKLKIGQNITAQLASTWLSDLESYVLVKDVELSMNGTLWTNMTNVDANKVLVFTESNISFKEE